MKSKGFTLMELLVVIAIIGILSTVILASLSSSRNRARDANIKHELSQMRALADLYALQNGGRYSNTFQGGAGWHNTSGGCRWNTNWLFNPAHENSLAPLLEAAAMTSNPDWLANPWTLGWVATCYTGHNGQTWMINVKLRTGGYWCVDSYGNSRKISTAVYPPSQGGYIVPTTQFECPST
ncbi:MAG: type II secretion system GspH family protein [Candidatus Pacebacteria bacterium]|nr:type II secretion system GspH family protein [Candidatus Paceibacterota bacterium]